jgi:hypothetical protein
MNSVTHAARLPDLLGIQRFDVPGCRLLHSGFALSINDTIPERPVNTLVAVGFDGLQDVVDFRSTERNEIRIAVHKADVLAICDDLNNIAAQQSVSHVSSIVDRTDAGTVVHPDKRHIRSVGSPSLETGFHTSYR